MAFNWTRSICGNCFWFSVTGDAGLKRSCRQPDNLQEAALVAVWRYPWEKCPRWAADLGGEEQASAVELLSKPQSRVHKH
jgi:hypothetical protein